ncbi:MAG: DNA internalization-related competence protein ComEC/Rec2 [Myxococcales bacterium]|nr:DNA internalization-related competence protein ComEC/Rec2 [Myxococcales bacterium]
MPIPPTLLRTATVDVFRQSWPVNPDKLTRIVRHQYCSFQTMPRLVPIGCGWMLGALLTHSHLVRGMPHAYSLMALAGGTVAVSILSLGRRFPLWTSWMLGGCALIAAIGSAARAGLSDTNLFGLMRVQITVLRTQHTSHGPRAIARLEWMERIPDLERRTPGCRIMLYGKKLPLGATVRTIGSLTPWAEFRNPTPHPQWPRAASETIVAGGTIPKGAPVITVHHPSFFRQLEAVRDGIRDALRSALKPPAEGMAIAWLLGETDFISKPTQATIQGAGLTHVLAVSGLNITLFAGFIVTVLARLLLLIPFLASRYDTRRIAVFIGIPCALGYATLAGGTSSGYRAAIMSSLAWGAVALGRRPAPGNVMAATALVFGALSPEAFMGPAFLLSILATWALVSGATLRNAFWRSQLVISLRSMLATAPLVIWCFGGVPLIGLLANIALVPLASYVLMPLSFALTLVAFFWHQAALWMGIALGAGCSLFVYVCQIFERISLGRFMPPLSVPQGLVMALGCIALIAVRAWRRRLMIIVGAVLLLAGAEWHLRCTEKPRHQLRVTFLDVGQGDSALVDLPDGKLMLIDAGGGMFGSPDPGAQVLKPLLQARRRSSIDIAVISHPHPDHYEGLAALLDEFPIGEIWDNGQAQDEAADGVYSVLLRRAAQRGTRIVRPPVLCHGPRRYGSVEVRVLWPCPLYDPALDLNDNSLVLRITGGTQSFLMTGDIEQAAERGLIARYPQLFTDVLKVPHHGSRTSSSTALLRAVRPKLAVISAGKYNRFGHPHPEVLKRLSGFARRTIQVAKQGGVIVK